MKKLFLAISVFLCGLSSTAQAQVLEYYSMSASQCYQRGASSSLSQNVCDFWVPARFFQSGINTVKLTLKSSCQPPSGWALQAGGRFIPKDPSIYMPGSISDAGWNGNQYWYGSSGTIFTSFDLRILTPDQVTQYWPRTLSFYFHHQRLNTNYAETRAISPSCILNVELYKWAPIKG